MEVPVRFELTNKEVAAPDLTTWLWHQDQNNFINANKIKFYGTKPNKP